MSVLRRRIIRPIASPMADGRRHDQLDKLRGRAASQREALSRWFTRLRRAFHSVERLQQTLVRLERKITQLETS